MVARTLTVVFTDIQGFTERTAKASRAELVALLSLHEELLKPIVEQHGGRVVKTIGDAFLLLFESPTNAVICGLRMQARLRQHNAEAPPERRIEIRIAINTGEVELIGQDVFGASVNLASRVEGVTQAGDIYFTEATYLAMSQSEVPTAQVGEFRFKGISEPVRLYRVIQDADNALYQQVLQQTQVPDPPVAGAHTISSGELGESLLYANEQRRQLSTRHSWSALSRQILAALVLLAIVAGAVIGYGHYQLQGEFDQAQALIAEGEAREALDQLSALRAQHPTDGQLRDLLQLAMTREIEQLVAERRFASARERLQQYQQQHPHLPVLGQLPLSLKAAEAQHLARSPQSTQRQRGFALFEQLLETAPESLRLRYDYALTRAEVAPQDPGRAIYLMQQLVREAPERFRDDPEIKTHLLGPAMAELLANPRNQSARAFYAEFYPQEASARLRPHIGQLTPEGAEGARVTAQRRAAFALLSELEQLSDAEEFRFYSAELPLIRSSYFFYREQTLDYFASFNYSDLPSPLAATISQTIYYAPALQDPKYAALVRPFLRRYFKSVLAPELSRQILNESL